MSEPAKTKIRQETSQNPMNRGGWGAMGRPVEKAKNFKGTLNRLLSYF